VLRSRERWFVADAVRASRHEPSHRWSLGFLWAPARNRGRRRVRSEERTRMTEQGLEDSAEDARAQLAGFVEFCKRVVGFWRVALVVLLLGGVAGAVYLFLRKPAYRSETVILYSEGVRPPDDED